MTGIRKQARNLLFLALIGGAFPAFAVTPDVGGPAGAGGGETVSVDDLLSGIGKAVDKLIPSKGSDTPADPKTDKDKPAAPGDQTIKAKRLDGDTNAAGQPVTPPAPYKVYPSPRVAIDDGYGASGSSGGSASYAGTSSGGMNSYTSSSPGFSGWSAKAPTLDLSKPPPLPDNVKNELASEQGLPAPAPSKQREIPSISSILNAPTVAPLPVRTNNVPPINALPKQFFPVLPANALPDTPSQLLPVASNRPLEGDQRTVSRAIIYIHDMSRNAAEGIATLMTLAGSDPESAIILAPQFPLAVDVVRFAQFLPEEGQQVVRWPVENGWQVGGESSLGRAGGRQGISSFTAIDLLLMYLTDRRRFPMMQDIVIVGHGMGGDFVQRYAAVSGAPDIAEKDGLQIRFIVANASSYLYFTAQRPSETSPSFVSPDLKACPEANNYPYGLANLLPTARRVGATAMRMRYPERRILFLLSDKIANDNYIDRSCAAQLQGQTRFLRGKSFERHLYQSFGEELKANQLFITVRGGGYDPVSIFGSNCGMTILFGQGTCKADPE